MIKVETHACGRLTYVDEIAPRLVVRTDTDPLDADRALASLVGGVALWRVTSLGAGKAHHFRGASPAVLAALRGAEPPWVVQEHRCDAREALQAPASRPHTPSPVSPGAGGPQKPSAGRAGTPSSEPQTASSSASPARPAATPTKPLPTCENCRQTINPDQPHAAIQVGDLYLWAQHATQCGTEKR